MAWAPHLLFFFFFLVFYFFLYLYLYVRVALKLRSLRIHSPRLCRLAVFSVQTNVSHNKSRHVCSCAQDIELRILMLLRCFYDLFQNCCGIQIAKVVFKGWIDALSGQEYMCLHVFVYGVVLCNFLSHWSFLHTREKDRASELHKERAVLKF